MIAAREVDRRYLALVEGRPPSASGTIDAPLGRDRRRRVAALHRQRPPQARDHPLHRGRGRCPGPPCWTCAWRPGAPIRSAPTCPRSGIRSAATRPTEGASCGQRLGLMRQFLHSTRLGFCHPISGEPFSMRVQTTRRSASRTRRGPAGASLRRARRRLTVSEAPSGASFAVRGHVFAPTASFRVAGAFQALRAGPPSPTSGGPAPSLDARRGGFRAAPSLRPGRSSPPRAHSQPAGIPARALPGTTAPGPAHARRESVSTREHRWQK